MKSFGKGNELTEAQRQKLWRLKSWQQAKIILAHYETRPLTTDYMYITIKTDFVKFAFNNRSCTRPNYTETTDLNNLRAGNCSNG